MMEAGTQVETLFDQRLPTQTATTHPSEEIFEAQDVSFQSEDSDWSPNTEESDSDDSEEHEMMLQSIRDEKTYLIFESCLMSLFTFCRICLSPIIDIRKSLCGSMLRVETECIGGHKKVWFSQPTSNRMPWGNFRIAAACLFSGCQPSKVMAFLRHMNMARISKTVYHAIQRAYLIPSVFSVWEESQQKLFQASEGKTIVLGGDARMDSPGHSAKYGSYTLMDLGSNKILDTQLIQVIF